MSGLSPDSHLRASLIAKENALLLLVLGWVNPRNTASIALSSVNSKGAIDVTASLVKLNGLPSVLGRLTNASGSLDHAALVLLSVAVHLLLLNVPLYLILTESKW